jgi:hypothetical protein
VEWTFGTFLWSMMVLFFWFATIWVFIVVCGDLLRRDMSGWAKAGWLVLIVVLPFLGILGYLIVRPGSARQRDTGGFGAPSPYGPSRRRAADEIAEAARLHDEGKLSADEFEVLKRKALQS